MPPYVSPLRESQAAQTRARILDTAIAVFGESGYAGTSLARIAERAAVSLETVKQNGPKSALLLAAFGQAFTGTEEEGPLHTRDMGEAAAQLTGEPLLVFLAEFVSDANARVAALWPRVLDAAAGDDDVAARVHDLQRNRRTDMLAAVGLFREKGMCRGERGDDERASALSFLFSPEGYTQLVTEARWSMTAYRAWLVDAVERLVLRA